MTNLLGFTLTVLEVLHAVRVLGIVPSIAACGLTKGMPFVSFSKGRSALWAVDQATDFCTCCATVVC